jgi:alpha-L-rhamnosidase
MFHPRFRATLYLLATQTLGGILPCLAAPVRLVDQAPVQITNPTRGVLMVDFGKVAFGNLKLMPPPNAKGRIRVHFGEALDGNRINRKPPGSVRYANTEVTLDGRREVLVAPPRNSINTKQPQAVLTPPEWGVVLPFRWVEIEGWPGPLKPAHLFRQAGFLATWNDDAASFQSSDKTLNGIWELCRYSIKATTFAGIYVDGDRERIPYEADAYLNQISHYTTDTDIRMARDSFDRLMAHPTWPTEWGPHMVFMAHADWMHNGDAEWLRTRYEALKEKLLQDRVSSDGWVMSNAKQREADDIVDWPKTERDGFVFREVNTVVNAFHIAAVMKMVELARATGHEADAESYASRARELTGRFNRELYLRGKGAYRDGIGTDHAASHASLFPLAFGLVPDDQVAAVSTYLTNRGMACSVYAAQYLLEGLFQTGADKAALDLITAKGDRSWRHMFESGTTITWEAWDQKYKPNQDWNHAWGAAPANLLPRFVLGAQPLEPGWKNARIAPLPGALKQAKGRIPTPRGPIEIHWIRDSSFHLKMDLPEGMGAKVILPSNGPSDQVWMDGAKIAFTRQGSRLVVDELVSGSRKFMVKTNPIIRVSSE